MAPPASSIGCKLPCRLSIWVRLKRDLLRCNKLRQDGFSRGDSLNVAGEPRDIEILHCRLDRRDLGHLGVLARRMMPRKATIHI